MRKLLMGTTAFVSLAALAAVPAAAQDGIKLKLAGYMNNFFGVGDLGDDGNDLNETTLYSDGEIFFKGSYRHDNGITFGAEIQLESFSTGDQIDENYVYVERADLGRFQLGSENTAANLRQVTAPQIGVPINTGWITSFIPKPAGHDAGARNPGLTTKLDIGNDENSLTYFTPRLYGFELGVSYVPNVQGTGDGANGPADEDSDYHDGVSVSLSYRLEQSVDHPLGVTAAIGYVRMSAPDGDIAAVDPRFTASTNGAAQKVTAIERPDPQAILGGIEIKLGGWTFAGGASAQLDGVVTPTTATVDATVLGAPGAAATLGVAPLASLAVGTSTRASYVSGARSTEGWSWDLGVSYSSGAWTFGASQFHGEVEGDVTIGDNDRLQAYLTAVEYKVGPGITSSLSGLYANWDSETGADNSGIFGVAGLHLDF